MNNNKNLTNSKLISIYSSVLQLNGYHDITIYILKLLSILMTYIKNAFRIIIELILR